MKSYIVGQITVTNSEEYLKYQSKVANIVTEYGGKYLVRGGSPSQIEGVSHGNRFVIIEFPGKKEALLWYNSDAYQKILPYRKNNSEGDLVLVDGI